MASPNDHAKLAADAWRLIRVLVLHPESDMLPTHAFNAAAEKLIELACDSAAEAVMLTRVKELEREVARLTDALTQHAAALNAAAQPRLPLCEWPCTCLPDEARHALGVGECHGCLRNRIAELEREVARLTTALDESVKLQSHYAELLNMHDGGRRIGFASVEAWLARLRETGTLT